MAVSFPIDIVFTWVDSEDPNFIEVFNQHAPKDAQKSVLSNTARFKSLDELKYALRSIFEYASWVNKIYIVTNGQHPQWLNINHPRVRIVSHSEILKEEYLPTFNSHVIESAIHHIEGLSEHYIYFNDDMMLLRNVKPEYFFTGSGLGFMFTSKVKLPSAPVNQTYDSATEWGAKNARRMIFSQYGAYPDQMFAHTFYPQLKSVAYLCESMWPDEFDACRRNKFRAMNDILCTGFLFPHVAQITGKAIFTKTRLFYFNIRKRIALDYYRMLKSKKGKDTIPYSMCPNDRSSDDSQDFNDYDKHLKEALQSFYNIPSPLEILNRESRESSKEKEFS
ncbi:stealth conserved region 3 domain-containing protein [Pantoea sp. ME81]|uniref:stealth conserved region 3 domain-containing protein n=1 Tax=Pantoea sp. ME81 TaxID=2743935 RepID=UPI0015F6B763|nr:stealth conserved region 3 domain-containing protein [Pantoea sp. ME81]